VTRLADVQLQMIRRNAFLSHRLSCSTIAALALGCAIAPGVALAGAGGAAESLSPRLTELAQSPLLATSPEQQTEALGLPAAGPASLLRRGGRVLADVRFDAGAAAATDELRAAGARIVHVSSRYQTVTVAAKPAALKAIDAVPGVKGVTEVLAPFVAAAGCTGAVVSEGDTQLNATGARAAFGVDGSGVTVGILSDSFDQDPGAATHAAGDIATGDLPGPGNPCGHPNPVGLLESFVPKKPGEVPGDEGRAMAQIVHDLAPGSSLAFASAFNGEPAFAAAIRRLAAPVAQGGAGAKVIVDDVGYFGEPFFQDGPVAVAAGEVAAAGASYFSAAGNDNLIDVGGNNIASWEAPAFRDSGGCPTSLVIAAALVGPHCMDFDPGAGSDQTFGITVAKEETLIVDLQWAEPWNGVGADLDTYLLDSSGDPLEEEDKDGNKFLVGGGNDNVGSTQRPVEVLGWENDTGAAAEVQLAINRCAGLACNQAASSVATPRLKLALLQNGSGVTATEYPKSSGGDIVGPTVFGHAGAVGAIAVGAVPFNNSAKAEVYSSRGPVTHYFGPVTGVAPAAPIAAQTIPKPDLAATDCGVTTFFFRPKPTSPPPFRFCGTSAAAPHAAAVAALMRQANPGASTAQVRSALATTASPVGAFGPDVVGAGLVSAYPAVDSLALPPTVTITQGPAPLSANRQPTIQFIANRPAAFSCEVDGSAQSCASPFTVPVALADGSHGLVVRATDVSGRVGDTGVVSFKIDTRPPRTFFAKHPPKRIRTKRQRVRATFRFGSNEAGVAFICKVDRDLLRFCPARVSRRFDEGRHVVVVKARDAAGNVDATPAVFKFQVKRVG
jgi:subtilase family protein